MRSAYFLLFCLAIAPSLVSCSRNDDRVSDSPYRDSASVSDTRQSDPTAAPKPVSPILSEPSTPAPGCAIKGNVNSKGEKIYHVPGAKYYEKTQIVESSGERWFCTEEEARAAGWRKSKV